MEHPEIDCNDYPEETTLEAIRTWSEDWRALAAFVTEATEAYGRSTINGNRWELATGGWSGNEEIVGAMRDNFLFWSCCWESSHRGGLFVFDLGR